jgi:hypothetical protein
MSRHLGRQYSTKITPSDANASPGPPTSANRRTPDPAPLPIRNREPPGDIAWVGHPRTENSDGAGIAAKKARHGLARTVCRPLNICAPTIPLLSLFRVDLQCLHLIAPGFISALQYGQMPRGRSLRRHPGAAMHALDRIRPNFFFAEWALAHTLFIRRTLLRCALPCECLSSR